MHGAPKFFIGILFPIVFRGMTRGRGASSYEQEKGLLLDLFSFLSVSQSGEEKGSQPPLRANGKYKDFLSSSPFFFIIFSRFTSTRKKMFAETFVLFAPSKEQC